MNSEDLQVQFKVIGISGAPRNTHTLGTYECIRDAQERVMTWRGDDDFKYTKFDEVKIVKHSQVTVQTEVNLPDASYLSPAAERSRNATNNAYVDYERQGVNDRSGVSTTGSTSGDLQELRELVEHLEERHVGLRHELLLDMEALEDKFEHLEGTVEILQDDVELLDGAVGVMRKEVEELRNELRSVNQGNNNHEQWRKQQELDRLATEGSK